MPTGKKGVTVYFDDQLYQRVAAAAKADRRSVANFIEAAVDAVAPHQLGTRVMLASRIAPTPVFEEFRPGDERTAGEIFVWATLGEDRQRFDVPRKNCCMRKWAASQHRTRSIFANLTETK